MDSFNKGIEIVRTLKQIMGILKQNVEISYKDVKLTGPQGMVAGMLFHHGEMKISQLSEKLQLSNSTVSGILDRLEKIGVVERIRSKEDRRVVYVNITKEYKEAFSKQFKEIEHKFADSISTANDDEIEKILIGVTTLKNRVSEYYAASHKE